MTRALYHRAKKAIVRRRLRERAAKKREREASLGARVDDHGAQPSPSQRPRYGEGNTTDDDVAEFDDFHLADIAGADDEWVDEPGGDLWEPYTAATNFDENDIAYTLIEGLNDEDHVVYPDPETGQYQLADNAPLQKELAALAEYQYIADTVENHDDEAEGVAAVDEQEEEEVVADAIIVATPWAEYHAYGREPSDPFEGSESVPQPRKPHKLSDFVLGWGLFCIVHGVSRKQYAAQLQLLKMLGPVEKVRQLPESLDTLKRHVRESLPHIDMRTAKDLPLNPKKLSSSRTVTAIMTGENPTQDLFFLNPVDFLARIQGSQLAGNMHYGMAELVDQPTELWHSMQWAGSVRTTSGEFAYYPPLPSKEPIFPGDIVDFECTFFSCKHCHSGQGKFHIGQ
ncbi:hypothetical protein C8A03DRAFT_39693, partial [Achaetomium macrosporum]